MSSSTESVFDEIVGGLDYPMLIVTAAAGERQAGCLVGFATQASISPPRFIVCLSQNNLTFEVAQEAKLLGVHVVPDDAEDLARLFGGETGDELDKLSRVEWRPGPGGTPLLERCRNRFVGRILERTELGDHVSFVLEPIAAERGEEIRALPFRHAKRIEPGHEA